MKAFISYCRRDLSIMKQFRKHLKPMEEKFGLRIFSDRDIQPGEEWETRIWKEFDQSNIIFILVSVDFLNSEFCYKLEFRRAIERHHNGEAIVVPIIVRHCDWKDIPELAQLQVLPDEAEPIRGGRFKSQDQALANVLNGINKLLTVAITRQRRIARRPPKPSLDSYVNTDYKAVF